MHNSCWNTFKQENVWNYFKSNVIPVSYNVVAVNIAQMWQYWITKDLASEIYTYVGPEALSFCITGSPVASSQVRLYST